MDLIVRSAGSNSTTVYARDGGGLAVVWLKKRFHASNRNRPQTHPPVLQVHTGSAEQLHRISVDA
jgi:hypothetical protein